MSWDSPDSQSAVFHNPCSSPSRIHCHDNCSFNPLAFAFFALERQRVRARKRDRQTDRDIQREREREREGEREGER